MNTFEENAVNATAVLLDVDISFDDPDQVFDGGTVSISGLLPEDAVSIRDMGEDAGQIGLSGPDVTYGGTVIGTVGAPVESMGLFSLPISLNAEATSTSVQALTQNLTYKNSSDTPTAERDLTVTATDSAGALPHRQASP